jgi:hypothetical protein
MLQLKDTKSHALQALEVSAQPPLTCVKFSPCACMMRHCVLRSMRSRTEDSASKVVGTARPRWLR